MRVKVRNNNVDKALKIFKRNSVEILQEVRKRQFYEKPSEARRKARAAGIARTSARSSKNND